MAQSVQAGITVGEVRAVGEGVEAAADVTIGKTVLHNLKVPIAAESAEVLERYSPNNLRRVFFEMAKQDLNKSKVAEKILQLKDKYPDLKVYLSQHPDLELNLHRLQEAAQIQGAEVEKLSDLILASGEDGKAVSPNVIMNLSQTSMKAQEIDHLYPGLRKLLKAHPDLSNLLAKNPYVFQPMESLTVRSARILKEFPIQSLTFFAAMGAVYYGQLLSSSIGNPNIIEQQLESQTDPVTHFSFAAFMLANGLSTEPLMHNYAHSWTHFSIPYVGLMAGMTASQVTSEIMTQYQDGPGCVASAATLGFLMSDSCKKVWAVFTRTSAAEKFNSFTPGLLSMAVSTIVSSAVTEVFRQGLYKSALAGIEGGLAKKTLATAIAEGAIDKAIAAAIEKKLLEKQGVGLLLGLAEGGPVTKFGLFLGTTFLQNTLFFGLNELFDQKVHDLYRNGIDSVNFYFHDEKLRNLITSPQDFARVDRAQSLKEVKKYAHDMQIWRDANLTQFSQDQAEWNMYLTDLKTNYTYAHEFYQDFLTKLGQEHSPVDASGDNFNHDESVSIDLVNPFVGVKPKIDGAATLSTLLRYTENARDTMAEQRASLADAAGTLRVKLFALGYDVEHMKPTAGSVAMRKILIGLLSPNDEEVRQSLLGLLAIARMGPSMPGIPQTFEDEVVIACQQTLEQFGLDKATLALNGSASNHPGQSFLFGWDSQFVDDLKGAKLKTGRLKGLDININAPRTLAEYYAAAMVLGPDANQPDSLVTSTKGFMARFTPPRIVVDGSISFWDSYTMRGSDPFFRPTLDLPISFTKSGGTPQKYSSLWDFLRAEPIMPQLYTRDPHDPKAAQHLDPKVFETWWNNKVDSQFVKAWFNFEVKYQKIIANFRASLLTPSKSDDARLFGMTINKGPAANGTLSALNQEFQVYLLTLGRVLDPSMNSEAISRLPGYDETPTLLYNLRTLNTVQWNSRWQKEIIASFEALENSVKNIKVYEVRTRDGKLNKATIAPPVDVDLFKNQLADLNNRLTVMKALTAQRFGTTARQAPSANQALAEFCIAQMQTIGGEVQTLAAIASAVSYQDFKDGKVLPLSCRALEAQQAKSAADREALKECQKTEATGQTVTATPES
jgi:hypothetical protein